MRGSTSRDLSAAVKEGSSLNTLTRPGHKGVFTRAQSFLGSLYGSLDAVCLSYSNFISCLQMQSKSGKKIGRPIAFQVSTIVSHVDALPFLRQLGQARLKGTLLLIDLFSSRHDLARGRVLINILLHKSASMAPTRCGGRPHTELLLSGPLAGHEAPEGLCRCVLPYSMSKRPTSAQVGLFSAAAGNPKPVVQFAKHPPRAGPASSTGESLHSCCLTIFRALVVGGPQLATPDSRRAPQNQAQTGERPYNCLDTAGSLWQPISTNTPKWCSASHLSSPCNMALLPRLSTVPAEPGVYYRNT